MLKDLKFYTHLTTVDSKIAHQVWRLKHYLPLFYLLIFFFLNFSCLNILPVEDKVAMWLHDIFKTIIVSEIIVVFKTTYNIPEFSRHLSSLEMISCYVPQLKGLL